jgi:hypothetical protein
MHMHMHVRMHMHMHMHMHVHVHMSVLSRYLGLLPVPRASAATKSLVASRLAPEGQGVRVRARVRARARARARVGVGVRVLGLGLGLGEGEAPRSPGAGERDDLGEREAYALARGVRALGPVGEAHLCVQRRLARLRDG